MMIESPKKQRLKFRENLESITTSGLCDGYLQANMITLPEEYAFEFLNHGELYQK
ncbi:hypothetical protein [Bacillus manliponensis]|uniref:hypothetical protein n=1 Tax=Bacillus manliponensis TaxID=574376 RepID=UPI0035159F25